jgi:hypothetical protein
LLIGGTAIDLTIRSDGAIACAFGDPSFDVCFAPRDSTRRDADRLRELSGALQTPDGGGTQLNAFANGGFPEQARWRD